MIVAIEIRETPMDKTNLIGSETIHISTEDAVALFLRFKKELGLYRAHNYGSFNLHKYLEDVSGVEF